MLALVLRPLPASAWGFAAHRYIMQRAIDLLPAPVKPFFSEHRDELVVRVVDPDLWRNVGWEDDPNHFLNFGVREYGPYPFTALPRDLGAAIQKFGATTLKRNGQLPWRADEEFGNLRRVFERFGAGGNPYGSSDAVLFAAVAAHYMQDATQPLHATDNYDGQLSGQRGLHSRFERDLIERYQSRLVVKPPPLTAIGSARDVAFEQLMTSNQLVPVILAADKDAAAGREFYDDTYFEAFFQKMKPMLEERLSTAISATASLITSAWEQAGKPELKNGAPRPVEKVERTRR